MRYRICHITRFSYDNSAYQSQNEVRMRPSDSPSQRCLEYSLETDPSGAMLEYSDYYGNRVHALSIRNPHRALTIVSRATVECIPAGELAVEPVSFEEFLVQDKARGQSEYDFLNPSTHVNFSEPLKRFFWMSHPKPSESVSEYVLRVTAFVRDQFAYEPGVTRVSSSVDEILSIGAGVCQDFAHLTIGVLRLAGVPARYVSGYLAPHPEVPKEAWLGTQASHAWLEAQIPGIGWVGIDPTNGCRADVRHVRVAIGRDYADVPPFRGVYRSQGKQQSMNVDLTVEPLPEPRQTQTQSSQQ